MIKKLITLSRKHSDNFKYTLEAKEITKVYIFGILVWTVEDTTINMNDNDLFKGGKTIGF